MGVGKVAGAVTVDTVVAADVAPAPAAAAGSVGRVVSREKLLASLLRTGTSAGFSDTTVVLTRPSGLLGANCVENRATSTSPPADDIPPDPDAPCPVEDASTAP